MYLSTNQHDEIADAAQAFCQDANEVAVILMGEKNEVDREALVQAMNARGVRFLGGFFPRVIHGNTTSEDGVVVMSLPSNEIPIRISGLDQESPDLAALPAASSLGECKTLWVLVDGLTANIASFLERLYERYGGSVHYVGGGAGSLSLNQSPCLIDSEGCHQDVALVLPVACETVLGVRHGWTPLEDPLVASDVSKNVVRELNWRNAFEVYREIVEPIVGTTITQENFFEHSKGFPFGITKDGNENVVRDPIAVNDEGHLICVGEVPQHAVLSILSGDAKGLIAAARLAGEDVAQGGASPGGAEDFMVVDCISRVLYLEDEFQKELTAISDGAGLGPEAGSINGILTLGEISSVGDGYLEFLNKTIVCSRFLRR